MNEVTGIIDDVQNKGVGKGSHIVINGTKYGAYNPAEVGMQNLQPGQEVTFTFKKSGIYNNIVGMVTATGATGTPQPVPQSAPKNSGKGYGSFPIGGTDGQRSIIRQNAVTNANTFHQNMGFDLGAAEKPIDQLLETARRIEAYTSGDDDAKEAAAALAELSGAAS